jgi:hypothetical protein
LPKLKIDPWQPEYGAQAEIGLTIDELPEPSVQVDPNVETDDWTHGVTPDSVAARPRFLFIDGVRRIDCRLVIEDGEQRAWGLLGSFGVGSVLSDAPTASWHRADVHRLAVIGGGMLIDPFVVEVGAGSVTFEPLSIVDREPLAPLTALQAAMRRSEAELAGGLVEDGIILADGPLVYPFGPRSRVVGVVKRLLAAYLTGVPASLLPRLTPGQRSPIFALGHQALDRYAWYQRIAVHRRDWHDLAGLVRCEVRMEMGLAAAVNVADIVAIHLPFFAGRSGYDPRAPQNLLPIGTLEKRLRHLLGDGALVRRRIEVQVARTNDHAALLEAMGV